jgi:NitT/TauT family transport system substrate-binding protein
MSASPASRRSDGSGEQCTGQGGDVDLQAGAGCVFAVHLKDVTGKTVATATFSSSNALWPVMQQNLSIDPAQVKLLKVDPSTLAPLLAQGKVDATINWITVAPLFERVLKQAGKELVVLPWSSQGLEGYGWSVMASDKFIKERPEVLARVLKVLRKSFDYALNNPDAAAADLKAMVPEMDVKMSADEMRSSLPLIRNEISSKDGMGVFEPKRLEPPWTWVAKSMNYPMNKINPSLVDRTSCPSDRLPCRWIQSSSGRCRPDFPVERSQRRGGAAGCRPEPAQA